MSDELHAAANDEPVPSNMDNEKALWYFRLEKQAFGPVSFAQLRRRIISGRVKPGDGVRRKGESAWQQADAVPGLCVTEPSPPEAPRQAVRPPAQVDEEASVEEDAEVVEEDAEVVEAETTQTPARTTGRKKSRSPMLLAFLGLAVVLVVVLVPATIAAYLIYNNFKVKGPAGRPVHVTIMPMPPPPAPKLPFGVGKDAAAALREQEKPMMQPLEWRLDSAPAKGPSAKGAPAPPSAKRDPAKAQIVPAGAAGFVYMEAADAPAEVHGDHYYGILLREIVRQALLLAARDEFGLTTRDALLGEAPPPGMPAKNILRVASRFQMNKEMDFVMTRGPRAKAGVPDEQICSAKGPITKITYGNMLLTMEDASRGHLVNGMRRVGFTGKRNRFLPMDHATPAGMEDLLAQMTITAQYQAVRTLHAQMRDKGESPGNLGALIRAYANLGVLTEFHWSSASKVFKARSLLYAARLARRLPIDAPLGHWHLAYAYALTGLHTTALVEMKDANELHAAGKARLGKEAGFTAAPPWLGLIDAYCHYDIATLKRTARAEKSARLAQLLWYLSVENPACVQLTVSVGNFVLESNPDCYRVHDGMCRIGGLGVRQFGTQRAPAVFAESFPTHLANLPGVPQAAVKLTGTKPAVLEQVQGLRAAGDSVDERREFSWSVLAHLARETHFAQLCQRLEFMRYSWSVPTAEYAKTMLPSVADHPYEPFIQSFTVDRIREVDKCRKLLARLPQADVLPTQRGRLKAYEECQSPELLRVRFLNMAHTDLIDYDIRLSVPWASDHHPAELVRLSRILFDVSAHSPLGRGLMIRIAWTEVGKNAEAWEKQAQHPKVLLNLGQSYLRQNRPDDAVRCFESAIAISPETVAFKALADAYRIVNKWDQWQQALERYLALNPPGLEPARVRVDIARVLMRKKQWLQAKPFADSAAATGADWAMQCASECYEGLGQWDVSERWIRSSSERYQNSYLRWFIWCKRTGHGDLAAATKWVTDRFQDVSQIAALTDIQEMSFFYILTGKSEQALWTLNAWYKATPKGDVASLMLLLGYDQLGEFALRDKVLKNYPKRTVAPLDWLPPLIREAMGRGEKAKLDLAAADKHIVASDPKDQPLGCYLVGRFLEQHAHKADAIRYYRRCVAEPQPASMVFPAVAAERLRALGALGANDAK